MGNNVKNALGGETAIDNAGNLTLNNLGGTGKANVHDALEAMNNKIDQLGGGSSSHFYSVQTTSNARGNYNNDGATGLDALAAGADAQAAGDFAVAVGTGAQAVISNSIAIGKNASVNEDTASVAAVNGATKGEGSVAIGANTKASGTNATAVGQASNAYGQNSFAGGQSSKALGKSSVAVGDGAIANQDSSTAIGAYSQSTAAGATALGFNTRATASGTVAAGRNSKATSNNALALGNEADAQKDDTIAIGYNAQATQNRAVAFGKNAKATAGDTFAFGDAAKASVGNAIAFGKNANAAHKDSIALGANSATEAAVQTTSATVGGLTFGNFAGNAPESTLSIGTAGKERTITNVAAGRISDSSTDAVNGSQLYATQNVMNNIGTTAVGVLGGNAAIANDGTITMANIGGTGASTIDGAISAINNASYKSFKLNTAKTNGTNGEANNHSLKEITNGSTITLEAGKNIVLNQNESTVSINTADAPEFAGKITAKDGLDMSNTKITNLGKGEQPTDAVNLSQLTDAINNVHVTTLTAVTNEAPFAYVSADGRILKRNVTVGGSGAKQVSFVYADDTSTPYNGAVTIAALNPTDPQTTVPTSIGNVAAGKGQNDAVNVSQLDKVAQALGTSVNNATGEIAAPKYSVISGSPAASGVADYNNVGDALTALSNAVRAPLTFAGDSGTPSTRQLGSTVTVKGGEADATKLSDSNNIGVVSDDTTGTLNVKLAKELKGLTSSEFIDAAGGKTTVSADGVTVGTAANPVKLTTEGLSNGGKKATDIAAGVNNTDAVNVSQLTPLATALGATVNPATGAVEVPNLVVTKTDGTQAAPVNTVQGALDNIGTELQKGLTFGGDNADKNFERKLGNQVLVKGGADAAKLSDNNIGVVSDDLNGTLNVKLAKDLQGLNSAQFETDGNVTTINGGNVSLADKDGNIAETTANGITLTPVPSSGKEAVSLTKDGLNNGGNKITKVAEGTLAADSTDAVNGAQLYKVDQKADTNAENIAKGINIGGTSGSNKYALGDTVNIKGDSNITSETVEGGVQLKLADTVKIGQDSGKPVSIDGVNGTVSGLSNKALGGADFATKGQAATEEQLNATQANLAKILGGNAANNNGNVNFTDIGGTGKDNVHDAIAAVKETADKGWNLNANDETSSEKIGAGDTVTFKEGKNVKVSRNGKNITVATSDDVSFNKVTVGDSVLTDNGLTVGNGKAGNPVSLTKDGLDNGGNKIANVAAGEADTDAVNVAQLKANSGRVESGDDNIVVETDKTGGSNVYKVSTAKNLKADSLTAGETVVNNSGVTVGDKVALGKDGLKAGDVNITADGINAGNKAISNVAEGKKDTDAVNVAQLKAAAAKATSKVDSGNDNIVVTPEQNADGSTTYKVATAPNLKADSFTAGDTVVNNDGVKVGDKVALGKDGLKAGDVNITADGINAGNKAISNVAEGKKDTDAVNVGQLNRLTAAAKTEVEAGTNIASVSSKQGANKQTVYTINADGASVSAGSDKIVVTKGKKDANNVTDYAVDLSKAVKDDIAKGVAAKDAVDNKGISFAGDSGTTVANKLGDTVAVKGDANITTTAGANGIQVGLNKDLKVDSVKAGDTVVNNNGVNVGDKVALGKDGLKAGDVNITAEGINAGGKKVTGVAAGTVAAGSTDAVNGGQLHQVYELIGSNGGNVNTAPPSVEADGKAGLGNIKNITLVDNSNNPNVTNVTNETKIAQSNGYSLVTYNVEDQGMYVTNNVIEAVGRMNEQGIKFFHTNDGEVNPDVQARNSEDSSASGAYATAVGFQAASKGTNAIAIGKGAKANAENTIAIGTGNIVSGKNSGAIGDPTVVSGNSAYSIGNNNNVSADNAYALGSNIKATVNDSVYLGDRAQTQGIHTADAAKGEAYTYGGLNDKAVAGKAGSAATANKVAGVVTVGNGTDETRQVQGVAAGVVSADSTDAINGSQLYYTNQAINQNVTNIGNYVVNMGNQINQRIDNVESDSKAGTAAAMAVAGLPQAYLPGKSMMAVAGGVYRGESGYAVGFSSISDGGNWIIKGTATGNSRGHYGATAGVGYQW